MRDQAISLPLLRELQHRLDCEDVFDWLEESAECLAMLSAGYSLDRVKLSRELFAERDVLSINECAGLNQDACIIPVSGGFQIKYRRGIPKQRLRFAIAHELGHTFLFEGDMSGRSLARMQNHEDSGIESLCDFFASALLLPRSRITRTLRALSWDEDPHANAPLHLIPHLADVFGVAPQAIARRLLFDIFGSHRIVFSIKRKADSVHEPWLTMWYATSLAAYGPIPSGWRIPLDSNGRKLPPKIVPEVPLGQTSKVMIDGRVHVAATPQSPKDARIPIKQQLPQPKRPALASIYRISADMFKDELQVAIIALR